MPEELRRKIADIVFSIRAGGDIKGFSVENGYTPLKIKNIWMIYMKAFADAWIPAPRLRLSVTSFAGMTKENSVKKCYRQDTSREFLKRAGIINGSSW
jgi:hypothetical protein